MDLAPDDRTKAIATLLDVSLATPEELIRRCSAYYRTSVTLADLRTPLWKLLPELEKTRLRAPDLR